MSAGRNKNSRSRLRKEQRLKARLRRRERAQKLRKAGKGRVKRLPVKTAFQKLAEAANGRWDGVDAAEYVRKEREGE